MIQSQREQPCLLLDASCRREISSGRWLKCPRLHQSRFPLQPVPDACLKATVAVTINACQSCRTLGTTLADLSVDPGAVLATAHVEGCR